MYHNIISIAAVTDGTPAAITPACLYLTHGVMAAQPAPREGVGTGGEVSRRRPRCCLNGWRKRRLGGPALLPLCMEVEGWPCSPSPQLFAGGVGGSPWLPPVFCFQEPWQANEMERLLADVVRNPCWRLEGNLFVSLHWEVRERTRQASALGEGGILAATIDYPPGRLTT